MPKISGPTPQQIAQSLSKSQDGQTADLGLSLMIAYKMLAGFAVIPGVLGLRSRYGERYLTMDTAVFSWSVVAGCTTLSVLADEGSSYVPSYVAHAEGAPGTASTGIAFLAIFSVMLALRYGGVLVRAAKDDFSVHSFSDGQPRRFWYSIARLAPYSLRDWCVRCVLEPGAVGVAGYAFAALTGSRLIGLLGLLASFGFFLQQVLLQRELRTRLLNAADAALEAEELREDRERLQTGAARDVYAAMTPPRARSALSTLDVARLRAARQAAQLPLPGVTEPAE
jgi:hypothetical protein